MSPGACGRGGPLRRVLSIVTLAVVAASAARAAEERLPEIVVTAPPLRDESPAPRDPTAFASVVETREAPTSVETLADVLADTVGVQVRRFGGLGDFSTVSIRGFSPGQVQVYLDGVPLTRADNEVVNLSDLPLDAVDHVEVYRGVTPLVFAQSGPGGVVNVVTRRPEGAPLAAASASYGSFDTRKVALAAGGSHGAWDGLVFAQYLGSAGDFPFTLDRTPDVPGGEVELTRINDAFNQGAVTGRVVYRDAPFTLALTTDSFVKSQGVPGHGSVQSPDAHRDTTRQIANVGFGVAPSGPWNVGVDGNLFGVYQSQSFTAPGPPDLAFPKTDVTDRNTTVGGQLVARGTIGAHQVPGVLVASSVERFVQEDAIGLFGVLRPGTSPPRTRTRLTLAGEDEIVLLDERVSVVPTARWELYHDVFPEDPRILSPAFRVPSSHTQDFFTPRLGVRADLGWGATFLGNVGRSARVPNLTELFGNSGIVVGNPELKPETAKSFDAGLRVRAPWTNDVLTDATVEGAYFASDLDDVIVLLPSSVNQFRPANIGAATIRGQEAAARFALFDRLLLTSNYTHQATRDESAEAFARGKQLPGRPAHEAYARLELVWSPARPLPLGAFGERLWPGRVYYDVDLIAENFLDRANLIRVGSRALHGVGVDVTIPWGGVRVGWEMKNLTDDQTEDALGFPLPGRAMFVTVSYGFGAPGASR